MHPVFVPFSSPNPMSPVLEINSDRRQDLIETYAETMIEGMDYKTMEQLVYDLLTDGMAQLSDYELCDEVHNYHGADDDEFRAFCESTLTDDEINNYLEDVNVIEESRNSEPSEATGWQ